MSETRQALKLVLEKIYELAILEDDPVLAKPEDEDALTLHYLGNSFSLNDEDYKIFRATFAEIMRSLAKKEIIELVNIHEQDVASYFKDPNMAYEFVADFVRENPQVNVKELMKDSLSIFKILDLKKLTDEISRAKSLPIDNYEAPKDDSNQPNFNPTTSTLRLAGKNILISRSKNSNQHLLLATIFKDPHKEWSYDEIEYDWDNVSDINKVDGDKFYNACYSVNGKIAGETLIKDFLLFTKKAVRINPDYV